MAENNYAPTEPVFAWSFPSNNLINISLTREIRMNETWPQSAKISYFFFVSVIGGIKTNENSFGKSYDFKNQNYSMKFSIEEIFGLAHALKYASVGSLAAMQGGYTKFARSNNNVKSISLLELPPSDKNRSKGVSISYSQQNPQAKISTSLSADHAIAMSEILMKMANRAIDLELQRMELLPKNRNTSQGFIADQTARRGYESPMPAPSAMPYPNNDFSPQQHQMNNNQPIMMPADPFANAAEDFSTISNDFGAMLGNL